MVHRRSLVCVCVLAWVAGSGSAQAQVTRSLSGKVQFDIAGRQDIGMPIQPGTKACVPNGGIDGIKAVAGAMITTTSGVGGSIMIPASQFTLRGPGNPQLPQVRGSLSQAPILRQVYTNLIVQVPAKPGWTIKPGSGKVPGGGGGKGRTGPDVVSFCPGSTSTVTMGLNPGCAGSGFVTVPSCFSSPNPCPGPGTQMAVIPGFMKYTRTGKMLGGAGSVTNQGKFAVAVAATVPGFVFFPNAISPPNLAQGMEFGWYSQHNAGKGPLRSAIHNVCGVINKVGNVVQPKALSNRTTATFGGPWTQGMLTVKVNTVAGIESYMLTGYDKRTAMGAGKIQLVSGSLGRRSLFGGNAGRGIVTLEVPEPGASAGAIAALLVLAGCHWASRRSN